MTDFDIAKQFFNRLTGAGFKIEIIDYSNNLEGTEDFNPDYGISINLYDTHDQIFCSFDFSKGSFYRISGYDSSGGYYDEIDGKKYN